MKVWLFITDGDEGYGLEVRATENGVRACAWAWLREIWTDYGIRKAMPTDLTEALKVAGDEASQYGRVESRDVELVPRSPLVAWLRSHFPDPRAWDDGPSGYSVSGALAFYVGAYDDPFPGEDELACHIEEARGRLAEAESGRASDEARKAARRIIEADDAGEPERSWAMLDDLLAEVCVERDRVRGLIRSGRLAAVGTSTCCEAPLVQGAGGVVECSECWNTFPEPTR